MNESEANQAASSAGMKRRVAITGTGSFLPEKILTNADLEKLVDTSDEWIFTRSGIRQRRMAAPDQATSDLAAEAARRALADAGVGAEGVDQIIVATVTPDMVFPNTGCFVQHRLGALRAHCFDVEAACSGFLYALEISRQFILSGTINTALIIGAEKLSCIVDWEDRATCVLFGDGAGAVVLQAAEQGHQVRGNVMGTDGSLTELLNVPAGGSRNPASLATVQGRQHYMKMAGREVFKYAVQDMSDAVEQVLVKCGMGIADVDWVIPHQANARIIRAISERLKVPIDKFFMNLEKYGNMSAASIPVALDEAAREGKLKRGQRVVFVAFGGGFTWSASVVEW